MKQRQHKHKVLARMQHRRWLKRVWKVDRVWDLPAQHGLDVEQMLADILQDEIWKEFEVQEGKPREEIQKQWDDEDAKIVARIVELAKEQGLMPVFSQ